MDTVQIEYKDGYAVVQMKNGKVNAINNTLAADLLQAFTELEKNDKVRGVILTGRPHCFSAGLDVVTLATSSPAQAKVFWENYMGALQAMVNFSKPYVAAIAGYAPAGATTFALTADYRVMGKGAKHVMGMNEFNMSLLIPELMCDIFAYQIGEKNAWEAVQNATMYNSDEALAIGLVNESVEVEEVMERAEKHLKKLMRVYLPVFQKTKLFLRKQLSEMVNQDLDMLVDQIMENVNDPATKKMAEMFLASLKK